MLKVAVGQAEGSDAQELVPRVVGRCLAEVDGMTPNVVLATLSGGLDPEAVFIALREALPGVPIVGGTSAGDLSSSFGFSEDSLTLTAFFSDRIRFGVGYGEAIAEDPRAAVQRAFERARAELDGDGSGGDETLVLAFVDGLSGQAATVVDHINELRAPGAWVFGGSLAYPWGGPRRVFEFAGERALSGGLALLLLRGPLRVASRVSNAWRPVGPRERVHTVGDQVVSIGERSALGFVRHYLGEHFTPSGEFPLAVFDGPSDRFYLRGLRGLREGTEVLRYVAPIPDGAEVQLCEYVRDEVLMDTTEQVEGVLAAFEPGPPAAALVFSCAVRKLMLGTHIRDVSEILGERLHVPFSGFYAYGEIAPLVPGGPAFFHNATMITLLLGEEGAMAELESAAAGGGRPAATGGVVGASLDPGALQRKLERSEGYRARLEDTREQQMAMLRTINAEVEVVRQRIAAQNEKLRELNEALASERNTSDALLLNILPRAVAEELKRTGRVEPVFYASVSVLFTDFEGFTKIAKLMAPEELLKELDLYFSAFDAIVERHGLEKLKTIGDAYMCAGGIPAPKEGHEVAAVRAAWEMQAFMREMAAAREAEGKAPWRLRIGIHTGPLMAGVIGDQKFAYDIWGDTVNIASRLESTSEPGQINVSETTFAAVQADFSGERRGRIKAKNAGEIEMVFIVGPRSARPRPLAAR